MRLVFELSRADNPRLYDELVRFAKGAKRGNRRRVLAYDGVVAPYGVFTVGSGVHMLGSAQGIEAAAAADVTNDIFGPAIAE